MITGITGSQGYQTINTVNMQHQAGQNAHASAGARDTVNINPVVNMSDEEAQQLLQEVSENIGIHQAEALSVHQGLDYDRVMALIGDGI